MTVAPEKLHKLLSYQPDTGRLFWRDRPPEMFSRPRICASWNARYAGNEAFTAVDRDGYRVGKILDRQYFAHRVIWAMQTGEWPEHEIDHKDTNRGNNRWINLRAATHAENMQNSSSRVGSSSRFLGVSWSTTEGKWRADITVEGRQRHLGWFTEEMSAAVAYNHAAIAHHGPFARVNFASGVAS